MLNTCRPSQVFYIVAYMLFISGFWLILCIRILKFVDFFVEDVLLWSYWLLTSWILLLNQHAQFDALEVRLKRREPAILDLQPITPANTPAPATVNNSSSLSFHNLDWDGDNYDPQSLDPSVPSRPLQVLVHLIFLILIHICQSCFG